MKFPAHVRDIAARLGRHGLTLAGVERSRGSHFRLIVTDGTKVCHSVASCTPSDRRSVLNTVADIRRMFR